MEKNTTNFSGAEAAAKIKELLSHTHTALLQTNLDQRPINTRPMGIQKVTDRAEILFFSAKGSDKNADIAKNGECQVIIANDSNSEYVVLYGEAVVYRDQSEIDELYNAFANTWFEGKEDPAITIIRFTPLDGHYWDSKHGKLVQMAGMVMGAITGKQTDDGMQGDLKP